MRNDLTDDGLRITSVADSLDVGLELLLQTNATLFSEQIISGVGGKGKNWYNPRMSSLDVDVIIVGGGPAGLSTALHLVQQDARCGERVWVLEKATYPREKLCGGGITLPGLALLSGLGLELDGPHAPVHEVRFRYHDWVYKLESEPAFVVVHRREFDAWLAVQARSRGVRIREGEAVIAVAVEEDGVRVETSRGAYRARALVAADGSNSVVRRLLKWGKGGKARLLEVLTPGDAASDYFTHGVAEFDWSGLDAGLQGYAWAFPSLVDGRAMMNLGVFDSRFYPERPRASLLDLLARTLAERRLSLADVQLKGYPIHWLQPATPPARPRVLLAGDAAGVDPLLGEGIAFALGYGQAAAAALAHAFAAGDFRFADYEALVARHWLLRQLRVRRLGAAILFRSVHHPWLARAIWRSAPFLFRVLVAILPQHFPLTKQRMTRMA